MNLYKIEYDFNNTAFEADVAAGNAKADEMDNYFKTLRTHVKAESFMEAVSKVLITHPKNKYIAINCIKPSEIGIRILE